MELIAYRGINKKRYEITYWRTKTGLEVDFILDDAKIAIEVKIDQAVRKQDLKGLIAFCEEHRPAQAIVISQDQRSRLIEINENSNILIYPWQEFLKKLWEGEII